MTIIGSFSPVPIIRVVRNAIPIIGNAIKSAATVNGKSTALKRTKCHQVNDCKIQGMSSLELPSYRAVENAKLRVVVQSAANFTAVDSNAVK